MKKLGMVLPLLVLFISCGSTKFAGTAVCTGRVCGPNGEPVEQYQISFGIGLTTVTGANGVFVIPDMYAGSYLLRGKGRGWTTVEKEIAFVDKRSIICVQVEPIAAVYQKVESYLRAGLYAEAESLLKKEAACNDDSTLFQFYRDVIAYCKSPSDRKLKKITEKVCKENDYAL